MKKKPAKSPKKKSEPKQPPQKGKGRLTEDDLDKVSGGTGRKGVPDDGV